MVEYNLDGFKFCVGKRYKLNNYIVSLKHVTEATDFSNVYPVEFTFERMDGIVYVLNAKEVRQALSSNELKNLDITPYEQYYHYELKEQISDYWRSILYKLPKKVIFNDKKGATTLLDGNDKVTVVRTTKGDKFDKTFGFLMAYFQHYSGLSKTQANKYINKLLKENENE